MQKEDAHQDNQRYRKYNNVRVNPRANSRRKRIQYSYNHPNLPHFENFHLYARYLYATCGITGFTFMDGERIIGKFERVKSDKRNRYNWYVRKDFTLFDLYHGKTDIGSSREGTIVKHGYLLDFIGLKLLRFKSVRIRLDVIDTYRGNGWMEVPRVFWYDLIPRSKQRYDIVSLNDDRGLESLEQVWVEHCKKKRQLHKGRKGYFGGLYREMKHADQVPRDADKS